MDYKDLLTEIWSAVYNSKTDAVEIIDKFFHKDYKQCINGIKMNRSEYLRHILKERENLILDSIEYIHALEQGNELFAIYIFHAKNRNHNPVKGEVVAYFRFEKQQLAKIYGQVRLVQGILADIG